MVSGDDGWCWTDWDDGELTLRLISLSSTRSTFGRDWRLADDMGLPFVLRGGLSGIVRVSGVVGLIVFSSVAVAMSRAVSFGFGNSVG